MGLDIFLKKYFIFHENFFKQMICIQIFNYFCTLLITNLFQQ
jgi:hypothetical protein